MITPPGATCDPETGICTPAPVEQVSVPDTFREDVEVIYVGDPMCSWCWGISPALYQLEQAARANGIPYRIVMGGLRPDNSEQWTEDFKKFLAHHRRTFCQAVANTRSDRTDKKSDVHLLEQCWYLVVRKLANHLL